MSIELLLALITGAALFGVGIYGALSQTNLVMIMMGVELMLAAGMVNLLAFWRYLHPDNPAAQMFVLRLKWRWVLAWPLPASVSEAPWKWKKPWS